MSLTNAQLQTLKTFVANSVDPNIVAARTAGNTFDLSKLLSAPNTPLTNAWGVSASAFDLDSGATYTTYDTLSQGKRDEWDIYLKYSPRDMSKAKNRNVVTDVWGAAIASSVAESVLQAGLVAANVAEVAIGGTTVATGTVSALRRNYVGPISQEDCQAILAP